MQEAKMAQAETVQFRDNLARLSSGRGGIQRLAARIGITRVYLSKLIHGHQCPTLDTAARIANNLGVPLDDLISGPLSPRKIKAIHALDDDHAAVA
jgi:transcriptional regulator with XRE-family HTH domain